MGAIHRMLYGWGFTQFGVRLLSELDPGTPEWFAFVEPLLLAKDLETRSLALDQIKEEGFYDSCADRERVCQLALAFLKQGIADERRTALDFFKVNHARFSKEDTGVFTEVYNATRSSDRVVATTAEQLLAGWGWDRDQVKMDKDLR